MNDICNEAFREVQPYMKNNSTEQARMKFSLYSGSGQGGGQGGGVAEPPQCLPALRPLEDGFGYYNNRGNGVILPVSVKREG